ncbi:hypothetical protein LZ198_12885 [Myxococcus sp. K15C18031901]|uniref:hypothetical protein n=1 Tax=Myxococcus dinghuensis TaxID=2906761 RepID=UPI0020A6F127|nr:hypothetical protein [Myxococcus dinghuensis]MCP3099763.1 hypothetical protein [Myxococcus dinghuensis]
MADSARRGAEAAGRAVRHVLEDPRLREKLPGGSLPLLGSGLVAAAVLLPGLPLIHGTIGVPWSVVMLAACVLLGAREWRAAGRPVPEPLARLAGMAEHPAFLPVFTALTLTFAFLTLGFGLVPLMWVVAAVVLGYVQWRVFKGSPAADPELRASPGTLRLKQWVLPAVGVCAVALLLTWGSGLRGFTSLGGFTFDRKYAGEVDGRGPSSGFQADRWDYGWQPGVSTTYSASAMSGRERSGAPLVVLCLLSLALLAAVPRARAAAPAVLPLVLAGVVTLWGLLGLSMRLGPLLFLAGAVAIDVALVRASRAPPSTPDADDTPGAARD